MLVIILLALLAVAKCKDTLLCYAMLRTRWDKNKNKNKNRIVARLIRRHSKEVRRPFLFGDIYIPAGFGRLIKRTVFRIPFKQSPSSAPAPAPAPVPSESFCDDEYV